MFSLNLAVLSGFGVCDSFFFKPTYLCAGSRAYYYPGGPAIAFPHDSALTFADSGKSSITIFLMNSSAPQHPNAPAKPRQRRRRRVEPLPPRFWHCPNCGAVVANEAKGRHVCPPASPIIDSSSTPVNDTPLDRFFLSYPSFEYKRSLPPAESFNHLRRHQRWRRGSLEGDNAWNQYQKALKEEFSLWYGAENDLGAWHALCRAIGIVPLPTTCEESKKVRNIQENIRYPWTWITHQGI